MKKDSNETLEAYKIRIDALEIINEAYLAKIEALEMLNRNLQFLRDARSQGQTGTSTAMQKSGSPATVLEPGQRRGRGRPRKYPVGTNYYAMKLAQSGNQGEKKGRGRPRKYPLAATAGSADTAMGMAEPGEKKGRGRPRKYPVGTTYADQKKNQLGETGEKRKPGRPRKYPVGMAPSAVKPSPSIFSGRRRRGRKPKGATGITRLQIPLEIALREMLHDETYNKATYRALSGILLCLFQNKTATAATLHEYIGGSKVTVARHTATLKDMKLITYVGSRKKGHYELTPQGQHLQDRLLNA